MCQICDQVNQESLKVRRIPVDEAQSNPHVFEERIEERIKELLDKYHCALVSNLELDEDGAIARITMSVRRIEA